VPPVEVVQRGDRLVIRAELPGLSRSDIEVDVQDGTVTLRGERRHESEEEERGVYRSERIYGTFSRTIPLPEGAEVEHAQATFHDGILEIDVPVTGAARGRRLEIKARSHEEAPGHPQGATQAGTQAGAQGGAHAGTQGTAQAGSHSAGSTAGK
jgi:HSP20 family protein